MAKNILILHGPNVNMLGQRPGDDPSWSLASLNDQIQQKALTLGVTLKIFHSNHEGELIDLLHRERHWSAGIILNPGALAHTSYVLRDAIASVAKPTFEVHLGDIRRREVWRRKSVLKEVCVAQIVGQGVGSYLSALDRLAQPTTNRIKKTLGRRNSVGTSPPQNVVPLVRKPKAGSPSTGKTIGRTGRTAVDGQQVITRALVRQKIADRLGGKITPAGLATWARTKWMDVQRGAPAESGQREVLEDLLQSLLVSTQAPARLTDAQLVDLMAQLDG